MELHMNSMLMSKNIFLFLLSVSINKFSRRHGQMREIYDEVVRIDDELKQDGHIIDINSVTIGSVHSGKEINFIYR